MDVTRRSKREKKGTIIMGKGCAVNTSPPHAFAPRTITVVRDQRTRIYLRSGVAPRRPPPPNPFGFTNFFFRRVHPVVVFVYRCVVVITIIPSKDTGHSRFPFRYMGHRGPGAPHTPSFPRSPPRTDRVPNS